MKNLLKIENLSVSFDTDEGAVRAVENVSLEVPRGESVGLVGESGCGKSVTALSILRLVPVPPGRFESGAVWFEGRNLLAMPAAELQKIRGKEISMIFQEPMTAFSPLHTVGRQLAEVFELHGVAGRQDVWRMCERRLAEVGMPDPAAAMLAYPFQLSGGMRQRAMIAMALLLEPKLIIADEPTTALDVTIQAQIFDLLRAVVKERATALLLITHDMAAIWEMCGRVAVMYASEIVEEGSRDEIFGQPLHPYTEALLASIPPLAGPRLKRQFAIPGQVPSPLRYPKGCRFRDRCRYAFERCAAEHPGLVRQGARQVRCFKYSAALAGAGA